MDMSFCPAKEARIGPYAFVPSEQFPPLCLMQVEVWSICLQIETDLADGRDKQPLLCRRPGRYGFSFPFLLHHTRYAEKGESKFYELLLQPKGIELKLFITLGQPLAIVDLVISGLGISVFPLWAVTSKLQEGALAARPISRKGVLLTWRALFMKDNNTPVYQKEIIRMMQRADIISQV